MKKRILVIEDNKLMCFGLKRALLQDSIEVDIATTVYDAIQKFSTNSYDLCLCNFCSKDESELQMMDMLRSHWPEMEIILMTAGDRDLEGKLTRVRKKWPCHLLYKPFGLQHLKDALTHALNENDKGRAVVRSKSGFVGPDRRRVERISWFKDILFSISVINDGEVRRRTFQAKSLNICEHGMVMVTPCLLKPDQVLSFDKELGHRSGVVVWSSLLEDQNCKAGIRFA